jgi:membrane-bound lytic murein transglycosylase C
MQALMTAAPAKDLRFASLGDIDTSIPMRPSRLYKARPPASFRRHIDRYRPMVELYSMQYELPAGLLYAMIETESSFNPKARSLDNAVGLMQLVPHSGARDAYRHVKGRLGTPTVDALQNPNINIQLGAAYLRLLLDRHFDDVENDDVRLAVALAAYNWGPGRVRGVLRSEGEPKSVREFESQLRKHAPAETRRYVKSVSRRMQSYAAHVPLLSASTG